MRIIFETFEGNRSSNKGYYRPTLSEVNLQQRSDALVAEDVTASRLMRVQHHGVADRAHVLISYAFHEAQRARGQQGLELPRSHALSRLLVRPVALILFRGHQNLQQSKMLTKKSHRAFKKHLSTKDCAVMTDLFMSRPR